MKKIIFLLALLVLSSFALAGVTNPLPTELNLEKGENGRFKFQIQTVASNQELNCNYYLTGAAVFDVEFDPDTIIVPAGTVREVYGTVKVSRDMDYGNYQEEFCISCFPTDNPGGAAVAVETCGLPLNVNVVDERIGENMNIPPKPVPMLLILIIVAGVVLVGVFGYSYYRHRKDNERRNLLRRR
jgi:hypothetical protein